MTLRSSIVRRSYPRQTDTKTLQVIAQSNVVGPARVIARNRDGLSTLAPLTGSCPTRSTGVQSEAIGEVVVTPSSNFQQIGSTGLGVSTRDSGGGAWIETQDPAVMYKGETTFVTYLGGGFTEFLTLEYLLPRKFWVDALVHELHTGVSIAGFVVVDSTTATANVTIDIDAVWELDPITGDPILGPIRFSFK